MIPLGIPFMDVLKDITQKSVKDLDEDEIGFLRARVFYLTPGELSKFKSVLVKNKEESK